VEGTVCKYHLRKRAESITRYRRKTDSGVQQQQALIHQPPHKAEGLITETQLAKRRLGMLLNRLKQCQCILINAERL
jgi:hypothetical protein